jgi:hypothetical protein
MMAVNVNNRILGSPNRVLLDDQRGAGLIVLDAESLSAREGRGHYTEEKRRPETPGHRDKA